jgi:parallel beta-helix repeat protein
MPLRSNHRSLAPNRRARWGLLGLVLLGLSLNPFGPTTLEADPAKEFITIGCDQADQLIQVPQSAQLDPSCNYTQGIEIRTSHVTLDCQGAKIIDLNGSRHQGILITAPADVVLEDITVQNCAIEGFLNSIRVERRDFKALAQGQEYLAPFANITIQNSTVQASRGSGIFINAYVSGVTLNNLDIRDSGSVGVYLEAGSKENIVQNCRISHNGYAAVNAEPEVIPAGPLTINAYNTGREGIAVDGSRYNRIENNILSDNAAGGIFLYKNCGEYATKKPDQWWPRWYGANGNLIRGNTIQNESYGVWVGSRMAQNQYFMDCSDPAYIAYPSLLVRVHLDFATENQIIQNHFEQVATAIRIEDDQAKISQNVITSRESDHQAIILGTEFRTSALKLPVSGTIIEKNTAQISGNNTPYQWVFGQSSTIFRDNIANGQTARLRRGIPSRPQPHLFIQEIDISRPK